MYKFLRSPQPNTFVDKSSFLVALAGLASAVANVHTFVVDRLPLEYIGCHHDLKPGNVLVENQRFILSDFGLARLKLPAEGSTTPAKVRHGFSVAPECQSLDGTFQKHLVHRTSDVWSLGCIMLDVATYMMHGPDGVNDFEARRNFEVGPFDYSYYHKGTERNPAVDSWIQNLITQGGAPEKLLLTLISRMLQLEPQQRPNSTIVEGSMIWIALLSLSQTILGRFTTLCEMHRLHEASVEPWAEKIRFESWMRSLEFATSKSETSEIPTEPQLNFDQFEVLCRHLDTLSREIATVLSQTEETNQRVLLPLRRLNTILYDQLPRQMREKALRISEILLLESDSLGDLEKTHGGDTSGNLAKVSMLARSKNISRAAELHVPHSSNHMEIVAPTVDRNRLGHHWTGWVEDSDGQRRRVLIDFKGYDDVRLRAKLYTRMSEVAELCQSVQDCESVGLLQCRGFFHHDKREAFGLVYNFPRAPDGVRRDDSDPTTLYQYMRDKKAAKPVLKCRFQLAYRLAQSLSEVHKIGWVHKGLSSSDVILFQQSRTTITPQDHQYLVGFRHSRPDEAVSFTEGPPPDEEIKAYQHPEYLEEDKRYFIHYDYYSLGMVLLEIGIWLPLKDLVQKYLSADPGQIRKKVLQDRVPLLGHSMGGIYQSVVEACLGDGFTAVEGKGTNKGDCRSQLQFQAIVLNQLSKLASLDI